MTGRWRPWLLDRPRVRRPVTVLAWVWGLALLAVTVAPQASAAAGGIVLNWTGLRDTQGVAPGDYVFAMASVRDQIVAAGPGVSLDPETWMQWLGHTMAVLLANVTAANVLTGEAGFFIGVVTLALWVFRLTVSTYWLTVVGEIARAITTGVVEVTTRLGLIALAVPIGVFAGAMTMHRGERGRGWTMILLALTMPALSVAVFSDPAGQMYGPDGILAFGRRVGFSVAEAATGNGALGGGGFDGQVDTLTASILTHTVREPLQLWNFGHVVDRVGGCGAAWSAAVRQGDPNGPVAAMRACGDRAAVVYVEHLDGSNIWSGLVLVACSLLLGLFMVASGWAVLKVSVRAIWTTAKLLPALWIGGIPGAPQRHAIDVVWQSFRHGIEAMVYVVFVSVIGLAIERLVAQPLPAQLGGANPFAHVLMMGACCVGAFALLNHVRRDLAGGRAPSRGTFGRATDVAIGMGMQAAVGGVGGAALGGVKGLRSPLGGRDARPPWEQLQDGAATGAVVHGEPRAGFAPVPGAGGLGIVGGSTGAGSTPTTPGVTSRESVSGASVSTPGTSIPTAVSPVGGPASVQPGPDRRRAERRQDDGEAGTALRRDAPPATGGDPAGRQDPNPTNGIPPIGLPTTGYGEDIPPNLQPPADDEWGPPHDLDGPEPGIDPAGGAGDRV